MPKHPFNIYREQLGPLYHGFALWRPNPVEGIYNQVSIGDVGYIYEGGFIRMFNVTLPWGDESNRTLCEPGPYHPLSSDSFAIRRETFGKKDYYSRSVSREETVDNREAATPDEAKYLTYKCRGRGALLYLPSGGLRQDVIQTKMFQKYIGDNVANWFNWSKNKGLPVERMEDLVFVCGCTLVTSWAAAAFDDYTGNAQLSLASRTLNNGGAAFDWSNIRGTVEYHDSQLNSNIPYLPQNRCVFMKCLRAKRILFWTLLDVACSDGSSWTSVEDEEPSLDEASNDPLSHDEAPNDALSHDEAPDDALSHDEAPNDALSHDEAPNDPLSHDESSNDAHSHDEAPNDPLSHDGASNDALSSSRRGSATQLTGVPDDPEYLDPLIGVLRYIAENEDAIPERSAMAVAHDNDLQLIERMDSLTGDAVVNFLHENKIPVLFENGVIMLQYPHQQVNEHGESDKSPLISYSPVVPEIDVIPSSAVTPDADAIRSTTAPVRYQEA